LWNAVLVGGWDSNKSEPFLGYVDLLGTTYSSPTLATGFGAHIAQPLLREAFEAKAGTDGTGEMLTAEEAEKLLDECMKVLFYRDARSINKVSNTSLQTLPWCGTKTDGLVPNRHSH
jgi:20S proteasome subunit beta 7